ncbi:hypothetical protein VPHK225_0049 [Vibrio phage K225]
MRFIVAVTKYAAIAAAVFGFVVLYVTAENFIVTFIN